MPSLSGSTVAPLYSLLNVARLGAARLGYTSPKVFVSVDSVERAWGRAGTATMVRDLTITDILNDTPNTASFTAEGWTPTVGMVVLIRLGSSNNLRRLFAGTILNVSQTYIGSPARPAFQVNCIDYTWGLNKRKVFGHYTGTASAVVAAIISGYTIGYTTANVVSSLATLDGGITFNGDDVTTALTKIKDRAPAATPWYWYCDDNKDIHFFATDPDVTRANPAELNTSNSQLLSFTYKRDLSQWITRAIIVGAGSQTNVEAAVGSTTLSLADTSVFDPAGGTITTPDAQIITYTATAALAAPSTPAGAVRTGGLRTITITRVGALATATSSTDHGYSTGDIAAHAGSEQTEYNGNFTITVTGVTTYTFAVTGTPTTPATGTISAYVEIGGAVDVGDHFYKSTFVSAGGETVGSVGTTAVSVAAVTVPGAPTAAVTSGATGNLTVGTYAYKVAYQTRKGETLVGSAGSASVAAVTTPSGGSAAEKSPKVTGNLSVGAFNYKVAYVTAAGETLAGSSFGVSTTAVSAPGGCSTAATTGGSMTSNTPYAYVISFVTGSGEVPSGGYTVVVMGASDTKVNLSSIPTSADVRVTARKVYRTGAAYQGPYRLVATISDNTTTTYADTTADASLGAALPTTDTGSTSQISLTSIPTSGDARVTRRKIYRTAVGSSVYQLLTTISNNTATTYSDNTPDSSLGETEPLADTASTGTMTVSSIPTSSDKRVVGRVLYRTVVGGSVYKQLGTISDNTTTSYVDNVADASLGIDAPTLSTAGGAIMRVTSVATSADPRVVARKVYRSPNGAIYRLVGTIADNTTTYLLDNTSNEDLLVAEPAPTTNSIVGLTGIPASGTGAIVTTIPDGTTVNLRVVRNDTAGQTALALVIGGDGIQETYLTDGALEYAEAAAKGDGLFTARDGVDTAVQYRTYDVRHESGLNIVVNLAAPTSVTGTFKIQRVTTSNFFPSLFPERTVDASVAHVTLAQVLGR